MYLVRPVREDDLPQVVDLARSVTGALTTLPPDESSLSERIGESVRAFATRVRRPGAESYLFVLEDTHRRRLVGTSGIQARVGGFEPFYSYQIRRESFVHAPLGVDLEVRVLHLRELHAGPSEVGSFCVHPGWRGRGLGRLLSLGRFLFMATFPERFHDQVIAELRGYQDTHGRSPFWESVGRKFFSHELRTADLLHGSGNKRFIADLMPRHPLYVPLLPEAAQRVIGRVHPDAEPALALLSQEGFLPTDEVDIFDAGPQLAATVADVRSVKHSRVADVVLVVDPGSPPAADHLVSNRELDFRCILTGCTVLPDDRIALPASGAEALRVSAGDHVAFVRARA